MKKKIANMFVTWDIFPKINKLRSTYIREISVIQAGFFSINYVNVAIFSKFGGR